VTTINVVDDYVAPEPVWRIQAFDASAKKDGWVRLRGLTALDGWSWEDEERYATAFRHREDASAFAEHLSGISFRYTLAVGLSRAFTSANDVR